MCFPFRSAAAGASAVGLWRTLRVLAGVCLGRIPAPRWAGTSVAVVVLHTPTPAWGFPLLLRFRPLSVDDGASPPVSPRMSVGGGGGEGGGELGGLSTLPTGAGLPSPGRMRSSFFPISAQRSAITPPVFLMSALISSVFFERSP